jgi:hypothetical protein
MHKTDIKEVVQKSLLTAIEFESQELLVKKAIWFA